MTWSNNEWQLIPGLDGYWSIATGASDTGTIVGLCSSNAADYQAFVYDPGTGTTILEGTGVANIAVSPGGKIALSMGTTPYILTPDSELRELEGFPISVVVLSINDSGQVLCGNGFPLAPAGNYSRSFVWSLDEMDEDRVVELCTLGGSNATAFAFNNNGEVVGLSNNANSDDFPVIWTTDGVTSSAKVIRAPGVALAGTPIAINDSGKVLFTTTEYQNTIFLLTPAAAPSIEDDQIPPEFQTLHIEYSQEGYPMFTVAITDDDEGIDWASLLVWVDGWFAPSGSSGGVVFCYFDHTLQWGPFHWITILITDNAGNQSVLIQSFLVGGDDTLPPVIDQKMPIGLISTDMPEISARVTDLDSWINYVDMWATIDEQGATVIRNTSYLSSQRVSIEYNGPLAPGLHTVVLYVEDNRWDTWQYNHNFAYGTWEFTVDTDLSVSNVVPSGIIRDPTPDIIATVESTGEFEWEDVVACLDYEEIDYAIDANDDLHYNPPYLDDGEHTLTIAGEIFTFTVDTTGPFFSNLLPDFGVYVGTSTFAISGDFADAHSAVNTASLQINTSGSWVSISANATNFTYPATLADGPHEVHLRIKDYLQNWGYATLYFYVDSAGLRLDYVFPEHGACLTHIPTISASTVTTDIDYTRSFGTIDGGDPIDYAEIESGYFDPELVPGTHEIYLHLYDNNSHDLELTWSFTIDWTAPTITDVYPVDDSTVYNDLVPIYVNFSDDTECTVWLEVDGEVQLPTWLPAFAEPIEDPEHQTFMADMHFVTSGAHDVYVLITDACGNYVEHSWNFTVDLTTNPDVTGPIISIEPGDETTIYEPYPTIRVSFFDKRSLIDKSSVSVSVNGINVEGALSQGLFIYQPETAFTHGMSVTVSAAVADLHANYSVSSSTFVVDLHAVTVEIYPLFGSLPAQLQAKVMRGGVPLNDYHLEWDGSCCDTTGFISAQTTPGNYPVIVTAITAYGNCVAEEDVTVAGGVATTPNNDPNALVIGNKETQNPYPINWYVLFGDTTGLTGDRKALIRTAVTELEPIMQLFKNDPTRAKIIDDGEANNQSIINNELDLIDSGNQDANGNFIVLRLIIDRRATAEDLEKYLSRKDSRGVIFYGHGWQTPHPADLAKIVANQQNTFTIEARGFTIDLNTNKRSKRVWIRDWAKWAKQQDIYETKIKFNTPQYKLDFICLSHCCSLSMGNADPYRIFSDAEKAAYKINGVQVPKGQLRATATWQLKPYANYVYGDTGDTTARGERKFDEQMKKRVKEILKAGYFADQ